MALIEMRVDMERCAIALERIAKALEALTPLRVDLEVGEPRGPEAMTSVQDSWDKETEREEEWVAYGPRRNYPRFESAD